MIERSKNVDLFSYSFVVAAYTIAVVLVEFDFLDCDDPSGDRQVRTNDTVGLSEERRGRENGSGHRGGVHFAFLRRVRLVGLCVPFDRSHRNQRRYTEVHRRNLHGCWMNSTFHYLSTDLG